MMLNAAQQLYQSWLGDAKVPGYKAPHAAQGTPPRKREPRNARFAVSLDDEGNVTRVRRPRLFKGHRP